MATILPYLGTFPDLANPELGPETALIGRIAMAERARLDRLVTLRADGHDIRVGADCRFLGRATVHIADSIYPTIMGARITVGRYALVHACTVADDCVIGDAAVIMDNAQVGPGAVVAAGALIPPGKQHEGGWLHAGNPARPVREVGAEERESLRRILIEGGASDIVRYDNLPPLDMVPYRPADAGPGPIYALGGAAPRIDPACFVASTAVVAGDVVTADNVGIFFACALRAEGAEISIGPRSNIQDNSILLARAETGPITIGADVTVGHNVRLGACAVADAALIGMGAEVGDGVVVEDGGLIAARALVEAGTVVKAGHIWAGRPAREFRPVKPEEEAFFRLGKDVYVGYARNYLKQLAA